MRTFPVVLFSALGCGGDSGKDADDTGGGVDDSWGGSGIDDSGAEETGGGGESGDPSTLAEGVYACEFLLRATEGGTEGWDCRGDATAEVDLDSSPVVSFSGACDMAEGVPESLSGSWDLEAQAEPFEGDQFMGSASISNGVTNLDDLWWWGATMEVDRGYLISANGSSSATVDGKTWYLIAELGGNRSN